MSGLISHLESEWLKDAARFSVSERDEVFASLVARHSEPQRRYHGLGHLRALFDLLAAHGPQVRPGSTARLAVWWHDAVYDPLRQDNEAQSALLARNQLTKLGAPAAIVEESAGLILMTRDHWSGPSAGEGDLFLDADIAILGAPPGVYNAYAHDVRQEYAWASDEVFGAGRHAFLTRALARPRLFRTDAFETAYGEQARANMRRERIALRGDD